MVRHRGRLASSTLAALLITACASGTVSGTVNSPASGTVKSPAPPALAPCTRPPLSGRSFASSATELFLRLTSYAPERIDLPRGGSFRTDVSGGPPLYDSSLTPAHRTGLARTVNYYSDSIIWPGVNDSDNLIQITLFDSYIDALASFMNPRPDQPSLNDRLMCIPQPTGFRLPVQAFYENWFPPYELAVGSPYRVMVLMNSAVIEARSKANLLSASTATSALISQ
jgi:hypothetical protein